MFLGIKSFYLVGALFFERGLDWSAETIFQETNKGKLWKDIKHKYEVAPEEEE